jgi:FixJ family two-component response regulator
LPEDEAIVAVIDDDAFVRSSVADFINSYGYETLEFASATQFLEHGTKSDISCIIADLQMPGMSGIDLQRRLSNEGYGIPMIILTAFPSEGVRGNALAAGVAAFISKPFKEETLIHALGAALVNGTWRHL